MRMPSLEKIFSQVVVHEDTEAIAGSLAESMKLNS
jgi:hypothetical protein